MSYEKVLVLNDQGGGVMSVSFDLASTLRAQDHGHPPCVLIYDARGNGDGGCLQLLPETTKTGLQIIRRLWCRSMKKLFNQVRRDQWTENDVSMPVIARYGTGGATHP